MTNSEDNVVFQAAMEVILYFYAWGNVFLLVCWYMRPLLYCRGISWHKSGVCIVWLSSVQNEWPLFLKCWYGAGIGLLSSDHERIVLSPPPPPPPPPPPLAAMFFGRIQMAWTILVEDHQRNISAKLYVNRSSGFWQEDFLSFLCSYIGKKSSAHWRPCFLTNPNSLNNLGRGSPKEHFCKIICKSVQWFLTRRFFKFSM